MHQPITLPQPKDMVSNSSEGPEGVNYPQPSVQYDLDFVRKLPLIKPGSMLDCASSLAAFNVASRLIYLYRSNNEEPTETRLLTALVLWNKVKNYSVLTELQLRAAATDAIQCEVQPHPLWIALCALCRGLSEDVRHSLTVGENEPFGPVWHNGRAQGLSNALNKLHAILYSDDANEIRRPSGQKVGPTDSPPVSVGPAPS